MNSEFQHNLDDFKPKETQLKFLECYLNQDVRKSIEELCVETGIDKGTYYYWLKNPLFNKWFYEQINANKHRFAPRIIDNCVTQAMRPKATPQQIELALKVLDLYTPTQKHTIDYNVHYREEIQVLKAKARELCRN